MPDFERTLTVSAGPDEAFRFLADPANLPRYVATMILAQPEQGDRLRVAAEVEGRHEEGDARYRSDPSGRRIEWGAEDASGYRGRLEVSGSDKGSSVTIHIHVVHDQDEAEINRALDQTVTNIQTLLGVG